MYHSSGPFFAAFGDEVGLEPGFGCNSLSTNGAAPLLAVPDFYEFFSPLGAVEQFFSVTFLIIFRPIFIERVSIRDNLPVPYNFRICRIFQFEEFFIEPFTAKGWRCCKRPRPVINFMPILFGNPFLPLPLVSAARPPP